MGPSSTTQFKGYSELLLAIEWNTYVRFSCRVENACVFFQMGFENTNIQWKIKVSEENKKN